MAQSAQIVPHREFEFTEKDFRHLAELTRERTGIVLSEAKRNLVYSRLSRRLRSLSMRTFRDYRALIDSDAGETELTNMINAITTNLTKFFREDHHFEHLRNHVLEGTLRRSRQGEEKKLRIWSAGCSSGEEAYSIAMTVADTVRNLENWDARILATDLDTNMLATGAAGRYTSERIEGVPDTFRKRYFVEVGGSNGAGPAWQVSSNLRRMIAFKHLNLLHQWPLRQKYDAIFCRNVVIYFDAQTKQQLVDRYVQQLKIGGVLYLGHSESLLKPGEFIKAVGHTTYERVK